MEQAAAGTSGDLSPWQAMGISGTALMQDPDSHSQPNHATGGVIHGPEFFLKLSLFLLVGGACHLWCELAVVWLGLTRRGRVGPMHRDLFLSFKNCSNIETTELPVCTDMIC